MAESYPCSRQSAIFSTPNNVVCTVVYLHAQMKMQGFFAEMEAASVPLGTPRPSTTLGFLCLPGSYLLLFR